MKIVVDYYLDSEEESLLRGIEGAVIVLRGKTSFFNMYLKMLEYQVKFPFNTYLLPYNKDYEDDIFITSFYEEKKESLNAKDSLIIFKEKYLDFRNFLKVNYLDYEGIYFHKLIFFYDYLEEFIYLLVNNLNHSVIYEYLNYLINLINSEEEYKYLVFKRQNNYYKIDDMLGY